MSHESPDVELLESLLAAFNRHDVEDVMEFFTEGLHLRDATRPDPWGRRLEGKPRSGRASKRASPGFQTSTTGRTGTGPAATAAFPSGRSRGPTPRASASRSRGAICSSSARGRSLVRTRTGRPWRSPRQPMLARSPEQVFAWRRVAGSVRSYAVVEVNDAVSEPAFIEKFELRADVVSQGALAASHHDRAQEQMGLVDQPRADCVASELGTPIAMSATEDCLSCRTASRSNSRSIRVLALDTV